MQEIRERGRENQIYSGSTTNAYVYSSKQEGPPPLFGRLLCHFHLTGRKETLTRA